MMGPSGMILGDATDSAAPRVTISDIELAKNVLRDIMTKGEHIPSRIEAAKVLLYLAGVPIAGISPPPIGIPHE